MLHANHGVGTIGWIGFRGGPGNYAKFRMSVCQLVGSGRFAVAAPMSVSIRL